MGSKTYAKVRTFVNIIAVYIRNGGNKPSLVVRYYFCLYRYKLAFFLLSYLVFVVLLSIRQFYGHFNVDSKVQLVSSNARHIYFSTKLMATNCTAFRLEKRKAIYCLSTYLERFKAPSL